MEGTGALYKRNNTHIVILFNELLGSFFIAIFGRRINRETSGTICSALFAPGHEH